MMQCRHTFRKAERLCSKKHIETLFAGDNRSLTAYPLRAVYTETERGKTIDNKSVSLLISVSKRHFKHAVDRNRVKRLTRECYRLHKPQLYSFLESNHLSLVLSIHYVHNEIFDFATLMHKFDKLTASLINDIGRTADNEAPCL